MTNGARTPSESHSPLSTNPAASYALRWLIAYLIVYIVPFPLSFVPIVDALMGLLYGPWSALMERIGQSVLGVEAVRRFTGSGDTTLNYVELLAFAALATVIATIWHLRARGRPVSGLVLDRTRAFVRLFLGTFMMMYGLMKVIPVQMSAPGPAALVTPFGDLPPSDLLWLFMGASAPYEVLVGLAELVGGVLLFWRRTSLLGALVSAIVLSQVFALNVCFDIGVKLLSGHLLLCAWFLLAQDARRIWDVLLLRGAVPARELDPYPIASTGRRRLVRALKALFLGYTALMFASMNYSFYTTPGHPLTGVYRVESFTGAPAPRWTRVGIDSRVGALVRDDGHAERFALRFDDSARTITWTPDTTNPPLVLSYSEPAPGALRLEGEVDGVPTVAVLRRVDDTFALTPHQIQWVQEGRYIQHSRR